MTLSRLRPAALLAACALACSAPAQEAPRKAQQIIFPELPAHFVNDAPFQLTALATSRLAVTYTVVDGPAVLEGKSTVRLTGQPGLVLIRASQAGNALFSRAGDAERAFSVCSVPMAPRIRIQPSDVHASADGIVALSVSVSGDPGPAYQWRHNGIVVPGATQARLLIAPATPADAGFYEVTASNSLGAVTSARAQVTVGRRSQFITFSQVKMLVAGETVTLMATATSGLAVKFEVVSGLATLNGQALTVNSGGVIVKATQPGDAAYEAAQPVEQNLTVKPRQ